MSTKRPVANDRILRLIAWARGQKVILDGDIAALYGVTTKALVQAVKRNVTRFPSDFMFRLTNNEAIKLVRSRSQIATLKRAQNIRYFQRAMDILDPPPQPESKRRQIGFHPTDEETG